MAQSIHIEQFLEAAQEQPIIDVRSPGEFEQGHIPGAHNIPLFDNDERATVGKIYKQQNRDKALKKGLEIVGPKMRDFVETTEGIARDHQVLVHCWRGGMRSSSFGWLLETAGFDVNLLKDGYKAYRNFVLDQFEKPRPLIILGGYTGSGKTEILYELKRLGEPIIDLEGLANHKGSAFGHLGENDQPSGEQFQNELGIRWAFLSREQPVWLEDESRHVGARIIPKSVYEFMREAQVLFLDMPRALRVQRLIKDYASFNDEALADSVQRISKRLGGQRAKQALQALEEGDYAKVAELTLHYYDKAYEYGVNQRPPENVHRVTTDTIDPTANAQLLLNTLEDLEIA